MSGHHIRTALACILLAGCAVPAFVPAARAQVIFAVAVPPPPLPLYEQPVIPAPGWLWEPGYWSYDDDEGYFWVPGTWVEPPRRGLLWTPAYWGYDDGRYGFHEGYWGEHVGFYGGVDYGYGYGGTGYEGGYWRGESFFYNRTVNNIVGVAAITTVFSQAVRNSSTERVSFNGGQGGLQTRATPQQIAFGRERHVDATPAQQQHVQFAARDPSLREAQNRGRPPVAATQRPADFKSNVVQARTAGERPAGQQIPTGHAGAAPAAAPAAGAAPAPVVTGAAAG